MHSFDKHIYNELFIYNKCIPRLQHGSALLPCSENTEQLILHCHNPKLMSNASPIMWYQSHACIMQPFERRPLICIEWSSNVLTTNCLWWFLLYRSCTGLQTIAVYEDHVLESCGSIPASHYEHFLVRLAQLQTQQDREGCQKKASSHSPSFILGIVQEALLVSRCSIVRMQHSFATSAYPDVQGRDTCLQLVLQTWKVCWINQIFMGCMLLSCVGWICV